MPRLETICILGECECTRFYNLNFIIYIYFIAVRAPPGLLFDDSAVM